ncbi:MAG: iron-containing alcohol dehydrogenase [Clostridia bacterium]|nr:iron-containing alcohol dehydrogenase [Clostridia bacterium]
MDIKTISLKTSAVNSTIYCGENAFSQKIGELTKDRDIFLVTDSNVDRLYSSLIDKYFYGAGKYVLPAGERSKNKTQLLNILKAMVNAGLRRNSLVIALGGGVVGDITGLAASLYMRGIPVIQIPTTLLSQVDSSVGGKTAIDFCGVKNIIGSFYQPQYVVVDPMFLQTLPEREIRCGLGEIIKTGCLNKDIFHILLENSDRLYDLAFLRDITIECIKHKAYVVQNDEKETTGLRKTLNLGHTTGHAFELYYKKKSHGEFVLVGMYYELYIAVKSGICAPEYAERIKSLIAKVIKVPAYSDGDKACLMAKYDKKNDSALISMIVPASEGNPQEVKLPLEQYAALISECAASIPKEGKSMKKFAVIGKDVSQSTSPEIHSFIAKRMGNKISYGRVSIPPEEFEDKIDGLLKEYDGLNVTIPYKLSVIPHLGGIYDDAAIFGAVNTVECASRKGYNTDGLGFMLMLANNGVNVNGKTALLLGAGGAGRSVAKKLSDGGAKVSVYDKMEGSAQALADEFGVIALKEIDGKNYDIVINATGVGMHRSVGISPVGEDVLKGCQTAVDLIYVPSKSKFLEIAEGLGKQIINGKAMLFYQAYYSECYYFGITPDEKQAKELFESYIKEGN